MGEFADDLISERSHNTAPKQGIAPTKVAAFLAAFAVTIIGVAVGLLLNAGKEDRNVLPFGSLEEASVNNRISDTASVYYLNFKPEFDEELQKLAATYTATTGVEVKVVTAPSGEYANTLNANIENVTIFNIGNMAGLTTWDAYALDMTDTAIANELITNDFNLYNEVGELKAIGYCYESYGIICNTELLSSYGYTTADITNFGDLKVVCEKINQTAEETGVYAFSDPGLDGSSSWRFSGHLANMPLFYEFRDNGITEQPAKITGAYLDNFKNIWDLYINSAAADVTSLIAGTGEESMTQFVEGQAVFYQNGTWVYGDLIQAGMTDNQLTMIPIYCGVEGEENAALCSGTESRWAINSRASAEDIQASIDFLVWLVSDADAAQVFVDRLGAVPFKNCPASTNKFNADGNALLENGNYVVTWAFNYTPNVDAFRAGLVTSLNAYSAGSGSWDDVVAAFVDGWATGYAAENS